MTLAISPPRSLPRRATPRTAWPISAVTGGSNVRTTNGLGMRSPVSVCPPTVAASRRASSAIAAAARGYVEAHIERGHTLAAQCPTAAPRPPLAEVAVTADPAAQEAHLPLIAQGRYGHSTSRRVRAPSSAGSVTFQVTLGHVLAKGLAGGRVRITPGESAIDAIARRIVRDTRCAIVAMHDDGEALGSDGARTLHNYRITLRGSDGTREVAGRDIEGVLWVRF